MKFVGVLAAWLAKAKSGRCPCGREVSRKGARLCKRRQCRKDYMDRWRMEKRGTAKSTVTGRTYSPDGSRIRIHYACRGAEGRSIRTHHEDLPPSLAARVGQKRRCPMCAKA